MSAVIDQRPIDKEHTSTDRGQIPNPHVMHRNICGYRETPREDLAPKRHGATQKTVLEKILDHPCREPATISKERFHSNAPLTIDNTCIAKDKENFRLGLEDLKKGLHFFIEP